MTQILSLIAALAGTLITTFLVPYLKARLTERQQDALSLLVKTAVEAAEQIFKNEQSSGDKKRAFVRDFLYNNGVTADDEKIVNMIESSVYNLHKGD
ncbi:MAG: holin [Clostridia bacterium]|nr:holin [Clostridia bacterium]